MNTRLSKTIKRITEIVSYGSTQLLPRVVTLVISTIVINYHSSNFWGRYVEILLLVNIALMLMSYGNFQYLLKEFSKAPSLTMDLWSKCLFSRLLVLFPVGIILLLFPISISLKSYVLVWILFAYINQSFQILIVFDKKFRTSLFIEVISALIFISSVVIFKESLNITSFILFVGLSQTAKFILYLYNFWPRLSKLKLHIDLTYFKDGFSFAFLNLIGSLRVQTDTYIVALFLDNSSLGKYHILITIFMLIESAAAYIFNPLAKLFYRISNQTLKIMKKKAVTLGFPFAILASLSSLLILSFYTELSFPISFYWLIVIFAFPQLFKIVILNELYKLNAQKAIASLALVFFFTQALAGYFLIPIGGIEIAMILRVGSFLIHLLVLHFYFRHFQSSYENAK